MPLLPAALRRLFDPAPPPAPQAALAPLLHSLFMMAAMVEARDPYTGGHLWRVAQFSRLLAGAAGWSARDQARVTLGGFLHDLGKIAVPDAVLNKPGKLTDDEYAVIKTHPAVAERLLRDHPLAPLVLEAARAHHETPDGRGYPHGLAGDAVPLDARIVGIADAFDAMTSNRPYRQGMASAKALEIIEGALGRQFDATFGRLFIDLGRRGQLDHVIGHSEPGIPLIACPNCGPTIVINRNHLAGALLYCRCCGGEAEVTERQGQTFSLRLTGRTRPAHERDFIPDQALMNELEQEALTLLAG